MIQYKQALEEVDDAIAMVGETLRIQLKELREDAYAGLLLEDRDLDYLEGRIDCLLVIDRIIKAKLALAEVLTRDDLEFGVIQPCQYN